MHWTGAVLLLYSSDNEELFKASGVCAHQGHAPHKGGYQPMLGPTLDFTTFHRFCTTDMIECCLESRPCKYGAVVLLLGSASIAAVLCNPAAKQCFLRL
eukprot:1160874-Pelagomonas_calceolata.AAC.2